MKKRFQTPLCALSALVLAAACTTAAYAAGIPVPADTVPVPQAAPADVADATPGADLVLPDAGTAIAERIPMPMDDAPAVWTEGRSAVVSAQTAVDGQSLILPDAGAAVAERTPMPVDDTPAVWTEGRSAAVSMQAPVDGQSLILPETRRP